MFKRVLIANRGEIAVRIMRACREFGISPVAVYSEADADSVHVRVADAAICIGPAPARDSYLNIEAILDAAREAGAEAVHPGYGFLSENSGFASAVAEAGLTFIGPPDFAIAAMGSKTAARARVHKVGVPVLPAVEHAPTDPAELRACAETLGLPLLLKAVAGGGGKGMRIVYDLDSLEQSMAAASREASSSFGDGRVYLERYVERARHIEVQVLADQYGNVVHLGERECSIQRRHQKIVEESPSPAVGSSLRSRMAAAAVAAARSVRYVSAGTVEFLLAHDGEFYFLEMNTRLQVEHAVTESVYGVDIVRAQIRIAAGEPLWFQQFELIPRGHAIECRIYAEDPANKFMPCAGTITHHGAPHGPGIRVDTGITDGSEIPVFYDPMIAKLTTWGEDREASRRRMAVALKEYRVEGVATNLAFLSDVVEHADFAAGLTHTGFIEEHFSSWQEWPTEESTMEVDLGPTGGAVGSAEPAPGQGALDGRDRIASSVGKF
ncbi:MAG: acetyl-CoA carboxylase biotin carboxylase subunit [Myxococcales bacterium]|nr:MAG: acetyl-CoA carboxylase biotin carboxylase subunit [Myxococcales bacterium]